jgi:hypothetical protein
LRWQPVWSDAASLVASADRIWLTDGWHREPKIGWAGRDWIRRFAATIERADLGRGERCFCLPRRTAQFERAGKPLVWIATIPDRFLRIYTTDGGGDYRVSAEVWEQANALLAEAAHNGIGVPQLPPKLWGAARPATHPASRAD